MKSMTKTLGKHACPALAAVALSLGPLAALAESEGGGAIA